MAKNDVISAIAVIDQENAYKRYKDAMVPKYTKIVYTQITRNTQEPMITIMVGTMLFPIPRDAAIVQSINAESA